MPLASRSYQSSLNEPALPLLKQKVVAAIYRAWSYHNGKRNSTRNRHRETAPAMPKLAPTKPKFTG